jgi:hypothetical protein
MYYRLWDRQCNRFMATGYNAKSKRELTEDYASYKSNDWENDDYEDEEETMFDIWNKMSMADKLDFIRDDEFDIERNLLFKFKENYDD